jgi:hypothetical protein
MTKENYRGWRVTHIAIVTAPKRTDLPDGPFLDSPVQPRQQKYSCSLLTQITGLFTAVPALSEGRIAIVTDVGRGCGGRGGAIDEQR